jgi:hypothetical protein
MIFRYSLQTPSVARTCCSCSGKRKEPRELVLDCAKVSSAPLSERASHETNLVHVPCTFHVLWCSQDPDKFTLAPTGKPCVESSACLLRFFCDFFLFELFVIIRIFIFINDFLADTAAVSDRVHVSEQESSRVLSSQREHGQRALASGDSRRCKYLFIVLFPDFVIELTASPPLQMQGTR